MNKCKNKGMNESVAKNDIALGLLDFKLPFDLSAHLIQRFIIIPIFFSRQAGYRAPCVRGLTQIYMDR